MSENRDEQLMSLTSQVLQPIGSASDQKLTSEKQEFPAKKMEEDGVKTRDGGYASLPQNTDVDPESARKGVRFTNITCRHEYIRIIGCYTFRSAINRKVFI